MCIMLQFKPVATLKVVGSAVATSIVDGKFQTLSPHIAWHRTHKHFGICSRQHALDICADTRVPNVHAKQPVDLVGTGVHLQTATHPMTSETLLQAVLG